MLDFAPGQPSWTFLEVVVMQFGWSRSKISQTHHTKPFFLPFHLSVCVQVDFQWHSGAGLVIVRLVFRSNDSFPCSPRYSLSKVTRLSFTARVQRGVPIFATALGEWPRLPSTARIGRALFHRARSASKEGAWPLPPHPSEAARCASTKGALLLPAAYSLTEGWRG